MKTIIKRIDNWLQNGGHINSRYDLDCKTIWALADNNLHRCELVMESFRYGYMQGVRATQAEMKKKAVAK